MADIVERLLNRQAFGLNGASWIMLMVPDDDCREAADLIARQREEIGRLREALQWYGENARLCRLIHSEGDAGRHALNDDGGKRARTALSDTTREE